MRTTVTSSFLIVVCVLVGGTLSVFGQKAKRSAGPPAFQCTRQIVANDWKLLLGDIKTTSPDIVKKIESDAEYRKAQEDNLRQLFAFACQSVADGVLNDPVNRAELDNIRSEVTALQYDKTAHKEPIAFSTISDERVAAFYKVPGNNEKFEALLKNKIKLLNPLNPDTEVISPEVRNEAKISFAKISLSVADSKLKGQRLYPSLASRTALQVKLQQAQFLARIYGQRLAEKIKVTDDEIATYIAAHPEFSTTDKRAKAQAILDRALAGEDFPALADQYSEDPGNSGPTGKQGGLYKDVPKGQMVPEFEQAALALEPGKVATQLVESDFGFHVMKLERKGWLPDVTYDVRHILLATTVKDPANPGGREVPVKTFIRGKLEAEKDIAIIAKVVADNQIDIAPVPVGTAVVEKAPVKRRRARNK